MVRTVGELVEQVVELWGSGNVKIEPEAGAPHEANLLQLNTDKARIDLGWKSCWGVERSIAETVTWYKRTHAGEAAMEVSLSQIDSFMEG